MTSILSGLDIVKHTLTAQQYALSISRRISQTLTIRRTREKMSFSARIGHNGMIPDCPAFAGSQPGPVYRSEHQQGTAVVGSIRHNIRRLRQVDTVVNGISGKDLQQALSDFFNSFGELSSDPGNEALRLQVLTSANALTTEMHRLYSGIQQIQWRKTVP